MEVLQVLVRICAGFEAFFGVCNHVTVVLRGRCIYESPPYLLYNVVCYIWYICYIVGIDSIFGVFCCNTYWYGSGTFATWRRVGDYSFRWDFWVVKASFGLANTALTLLFSDPTHLTEYATYAVIVSSSFSPSGHRDGIL
jgi:hypothetical protein